MGSRYEIIKDLENDPIFFMLLKKGMIALSVTTKKVYYEHYANDLISTRNKWQSIINTSLEYNVSESSVRRAIKYMEEG